VEGDATWQQRWKRIVDLPTTNYSVQEGKVGRPFLAKLASEFRGIHARTWNSERPLVYVAVFWMCMFLAVPKQAPKHSGDCQRSAFGLDSTSLLSIIADSRDRFDTGSTDPTPHSRWSKVF
jgi:hypothetical protein